MISRRSTLSPVLRVFAGTILLFCLASCAQKVVRDKVPGGPALQDPMSGLDAPLDDDFQRAYLHYQRGDLRRARQQFEKILAQDARHFPSYLALGYTYILEGNVDSAENYVRKAVEIAPDYAQAHYALAFIHESRQNYDEAIAELDQVSRINPDYPSLQQNRNILKLKATEMHLNAARELTESNPSQAVSHLRAAQALAPEISQIPLDIAEILIKQGNCADAVSYLKTSIEKAPDNQEAKLKLAQCYERLREFELALQLYQEIALLQPQDDQIRKNIDRLNKLIYITNLPAEYQVISSTEQITRGQLASLLMINLEFLRDYAPGNSQIITDTIHHWAKIFIQQTIDLGIMDLFPNRTFQPNRPIRKLELAKAATRIVEILETRLKQPLSKNENIAIPDINPSSVYYPMILKAVSSGVMSLDTDGRFHPSRGVSGAEAISLVNRLRKILES